MWKRVADAARGRRRGRASKPRRQPATAPGCPLRGQALLIAERLLARYIDRAEYHDFLLSACNPAARAHLGRAVDAERRRQYRLAPAGVGYYVAEGPTTDLEGHVLRNTFLAPAYGPKNVRGLRSLLRGTLKRELGAGGLRRRVRRFQAWLRRQLGVLRFEAVDFHLLIHLYCQENWKQYHELLDCDGVAEFKEILATSVGTFPSDITARLSKQGRLVQMGAVHAEVGGFSWNVAVQEQIAQLIAGNLNRNFADNFCYRETRRTLAYDSFLLPAESKRIVRDLLRAKTPCNLLFHGAPGLGKTEFARAAIAAAGRTAYFLRPADNGQDPGDRRLHLQAAVNRIPPHHGVLVIDEADSLLNTGYHRFSSMKTLDKGWLNWFIERAPVHILWLTNDTEAIEESLLRRFAYTLAFRPFTAAQRERIWQQVVADQLPAVRPAARAPVDPPAALAALFHADYLRDLAGRFDISAGGIAAAVAAMRAMAPAPTAAAADLQPLLENILAAHQEITGRRRPSFHRISQGYAPEALNLDTAPDRIVDALREYCRRREAAGGAAAANDLGGVTLLFYGLPGTGKTEFAKHLAHECRLALLVKRASDLLGPYLGQTEALIRQAFSEARESRAILFIDEADSLFHDRGEAARSWELSQTNELLVQMENFSGILICCTNLRDRLDPAAARRFHWKVEFRPLRPEARALLVARYFPAAAGLTAEALRRLAAIVDLTAGDIRAVWNRWRLAPADPVDADRIVVELEREAAYRSGSAGGEGRRLGF